MNPVRTLAGWLRKRKTLGRWALAAIPDVRRTVRVERIGPFTIRLRRHRMYWLRDPLTHERVMLGSLSRLVREGDTAYDVGANIGLYARFMAHFGAERLVCFEPMSQNRPLLTHNLALGGLADRATVLDVALAERDSEEALQIDRLTSGSAALDRVTGGQASASHQQYGVKAEVETVRVRTLDGLLASRPDLPPPNVIKIDIEGAEAMALRGMRATLERHAPRLAIELHSPEVRREVVNVLHDLGYFIYGFTFADARRVYRRVTPATLDELGDLYDLHFVFASRREADVSGAMPTLQQK
jgi:FkbM family methyltransferase